MDQSLSIKELSEAVSGQAAAIRSITRLQPVGGRGDKIFPPIYAGGGYATEKRRIPGPDRDIDCVLLNSVQSEANHAEEALLRAIERGELVLPLIEVDFSEANKELLKPLPNLTSLEVPHRLADAILRDCNLPDGVRFNKSPQAESWSKASAANATPVYELCPTALVFGMWGSPAKPGGLGAKFERSYVSEIIAIDTNYDSSEKLQRLGVRIDPLEISSHVLVKKTADGFELSPTPKDKAAIRPSEINHGNVIHTSANTGIRCDYAEQTTVISLGALRKLRFPIEGKGQSKADNAGRTVLAALGLCAAVIASERGTSLRSRCHLWPVEARRWELLNVPGEKPRSFVLKSADVIELLKLAVKAAREVGLNWNEKTIELKPSAELIQLIRNSQEKAAKGEDNTAQVEAKGAGA